MEIIRPHSGPSALSERIGATSSPGVIAALVELRYQLALHYGPDHAFVVMGHGQVLAKSTSEGVVYPNMYEQEGK